MNDKLIFEESSPGRSACALPALDVPAQDINKLLPPTVLRQTPADLPEVDELTLVRHYTNLSRKNFGVDSGFYPLGSCTMKYNPKVNETLCGLTGFAQLHPYQPASTVQGILRIMYELGEYLKEISGLDGVSLTPAAGAHGEFTGLKVIHQYFKKHNDKRTKVLIPDSAHGTNPASGALCGFHAVEVKSDPHGNVDIADLKAKMNNEVAALMLTIPNTLGLFDEHIAEICQIVHDGGGFIYMDGANFNSIMGITKPSMVCVDVLHFNLHKTFSTPHGCGGPGSGPIAVTAKLTPYLPVPTVSSPRWGLNQPISDGLGAIVTKDENGYSLNYDRPDSIGQIKGFFGNIAVLIRAYVYIRMMGPAGLKKASQMAVLNANYVMAQLKQHYHLQYDRHCMHECVLDATIQLKKFGVRTLDIAKRLLDYGYHPPTIYFPLIVHEALMIEPTETESKETLDEFISVMIAIAKEAETTPDVVKTAPTSTPVGRLDEVKAARELRVRYTK
ncbi:MAG: aminomethyl-transferring glycine dehydrogenase subunit GcvPB [Planctomycetes bacterium]|nr:aminomethyl-transferring glycine dehydrogenase subunit GcvPB [Planctomycetota bacterium]